MSYVGCGWCLLCHHRMRKMTIYNYIQYCAPCWDNSTFIVFDERDNMWSYNEVSYTHSEMIRLIKLKAFL
jgi:hypothetical protein